MNVRIKLSLSLAAIGAVAMAAPVAAQIAPGRTPIAAPTPTPTPAAPEPTTTISQALPSETDLATLDRLLGAAQLNQTLAMAGPYTIFAPQDDAFTRLAPGTVDTLLKPENASSLQAILKYHVVPGKLDRETLMSMIEKGGGSASLTTLQGQPLTATEESGTILLSGANGTKGYVSKPEEDESNGVIQFVNGVLTPDLTAAAQQPAAGTQPSTATPATDDAMDDMSAPDTQDDGDATMPDDTDDSGM